MNPHDERFSASGLATAYRRRRNRLHPEEVTEFFLARIAEYDSAIAAMVTVTAEAARRQAREAAKRITDGDPSPLLGVPIVLKDLIDVRGVPTRAGSEVLHDNVPNRSATVWNRLHRAGAVLLGKANTHEFAYGGTTEPTRNPWNTDHLVGGSSGGPGAALAAGLCAGAVGTDTAGSIRIPANLCGVAGLKPTLGTVSPAGVIPLSPSLDVVGPMAHHPDDLGVLMSAMCRDRAFEQIWHSARSAVQQHRAAKTLRVGVVSNTGALTPGALAAFEAAVEAASTFGPLTDVAIDGFQTSVNTDFTILGVEAVAVHRKWSEQRHRYTPYVRERLEQAAETRAVDYVDALASAAVLRTSVDRLISDFDVLVLPGVPFPAPRCGVTEVDIAGHVEHRDTAMCRNTAFANITGHPTLALPVGFENEMPVGIQLVAQRGADALLLAVGAALADSLEAPTLAPAFRRNGIGDQPHD